MDTAKSITFFQLTAPYNVFSRLLLLGPRDCGFEPPHRHMVHEKVFYFLDLIIAKLSLFKNLSALYILTWRMLQWLSVTVTLHFAGSTVFFQNDLVFCLISNALARSLRSGPCYPSSSSSWSLLHIGWPGSNLSLSNPSPRMRSAPLAAPRNSSTHFSTSDNYHGKTGRF